MITIKKTIIHVNITPPQDADGDPPADASQEEQQHLSGAQQRQA